MIKATFVLERETKGTWRYRETDSVGNMLDIGVAKIGVIYIKKSLTAGTPPRAIDVEISAA
jgi:hypothetical protein